jgi:hypothetical protein
VHISLGDEINSVTVSFASATFTSQVYWSTEEADLQVADWSALPPDSFAAEDGSSGGGVRVATGSYRTHSEIYCECLFN